ALAELRFLGVVSAKLRAEVLPGGRAPKFNVAVTGTERLSAEHAATRAAVDEIPAAHEHRSLPPNSAVLPADRRRRVVNARLRRGLRVPVLPAQASTTLRGKRAPMTNRPEPPKQGLQATNLSRASPLPDDPLSPAPVWQINHTRNNSRHRRGFGRDRAMVSTPITGGDIGGGVRNVSSISSSGARIGAKALSSGAD